MYSFGYSVVAPYSGFTYSHHESKTYAQYHGEHHYHHPQNQQYLVKLGNPYNYWQAQYNPQSKRRCKYLYDQNMVISERNDMSATELKRKILDRKKLPINL